MLAVLPNEKEDFNGYLSGFNGEELYSLMTRIDPRGANYVFPAFESENDVSLVPLLKKIGINDAFSDGAADFSEMSSDAEGLYITEAEQRAKIKVDGKGLEGAAAVRIEMGRKGASDYLTGDSLLLEFNRPFLYFICTPSGIPMLCGTVTGF